MCIRIDRPRAAYRLQTDLFVPRPIQEVFTLFADPGNLNAITPGWLHFEILTPLPASMEPGLLLDYRLRLRGVPMNWQSEITVWDPPYRFVDVQRKGPYKKWIHEHLFAPKEGGTEISDSVDYAVPGGFLVNKMVVERELHSIFRYRRDKLTEIFSSHSRVMDQPTIPVPLTKGERVGICRDTV